VPAQEPVPTPCADAAQDDRVVIWAGAGRVFEHDGGIYLARAGRTNELPTLRGFTDPALSVNGRMIVCVKRMHKPVAERVEADDTLKTELWLYDMKAQRLQLILTERRKSPLPDHGIFRWFSQPRFAWNGRTIYFMADVGAAVTKTVAMIDTANGTVHEVSLGLDYYVVRDKQFGWQDYLVVLKHKYIAGGGSYNWYWLVKPDGKEIDPVGESVAYFSKYYEIE
jgi:hypothetical protein